MESPFFSSSIPFVTAPTARVVWTSACGIARVAADGDRHLADAADVEHVELARGEREPGVPRLGEELERERVARLLRHPMHPIGPREHRVGRGRDGAHLRLDPLRGHVVVEVEELHPGHVEPLGHDLGEALEELVAELVVLLALRPEALAVERDGANELGRLPVEVPAVGRHEPRPAEDVARPDGLEDERPVRGREGLDGDRPLAHDVELVGVLPLLEEVRPRVPLDVRGATRDRAPGAPSSFP